MPFLSVIVPVLDSPAMLATSLSSISRSAFHDYELLIADNGSPDGEDIVPIAACYGAKLVRLPVPRGLAAARNAAVRQTTGEVLVFLDAGCTVHEDTLQRFADAFRDHPDLHALMGSYDMSSHVPGVVATFRTLLHAHVHHRSSRSASTFWTGCGAVRRTAFEALRGFDETCRQLADVELGMRLHQAGYHLELDPEIQVSHHKEWTFMSMLRMDVFDRAAPWAELMLRYGLPDDLNFRWRDRAAALTAALLPVMAFLGFRFGHHWAVAALLSLALYLIFELPLIRFFRRQRGLRFAAAALPLTIAHQLSAVTGLALGVARWELVHTRWIGWVAGGAAVLIFGVIQFGGGAYSAAFDGYPDEPAQFLTGVMVRDYAVHWPPVAPLEFARRFYIHYPKIGFGHWPPAFHLLEAAVFLFLPPARWSALLMIGLLGLACTLLFYRIALRILSPLWSVAVTGILVATPVVRQSMALTMAETLSLLFGLLFLDALIRLLRSDVSLRLTVEKGVWCLLCILVKGTGVVLLASLPLALLIGRRWKILRRPMVWVPGILMLVVSLVLFVNQNGSLASALSWAGVRLDVPWTINLLGKLAGWGVVAGAITGVCMAFGSNATMVASAALLLSVAAGSFLMRAMNEPRHWILALPALLILAAFPLQTLARRTAGWTRSAILLAAFAAVAATFPYQRYHQPPMPHANVLERLPSPARVMVSTATEYFDGSWIVLGSLRERRPSSVFIRASKVYTQQDWNGEQYKLLVRSPDEAVTLLDLYSVDRVIIDDRLIGLPAAPHHEFLKRALASSDKWKQVMQDPEVALWARVGQSPVVGRKLRIRVSGGPNRYVEER